MTKQTKGLGGHIMPLGPATVFPVATPEHLPEVAKKALVMAFELIEGDFSQREADFATLVVRALYETNEMLVSALASTSSALAAQRAYSRLADLAEAQSDTLKSIAKTNQMLTDEMLFGGSDDEEYGETCGA